MPVLEQGLIQIYMGDGKGKTSSALGLAVRMAGCGGRTIIIQFLKGWKYSEAKGLAFLPGVRLVQTGRPDYLYPDALAAEDYREAERGLETARQALFSGEYDLVILDEISVALSFGLLKTEEVLELFSKKLRHTELVLTGRNPPPQLVAGADLVTDMREVRHPYSRGILSRKGIDC